MAYEHLRLEREASVNERHKQRPKPPWTPNDPHAFGTSLGERLQTAKERLKSLEHADIGGFDDRKLLKLTLREGEQLPQLDAIPGVEILSQEDKHLILAFATEGALDEMESRLATLARDGRVTRKDVFYALQDFAQWTPEERTGSALQSHGFPDSEFFILDVELWPQTERADLRTELVESFKQWLSERNVEPLDIVRQPSLVMVRVRCTQGVAEQLLRHRDVRTVDLPPRVGVDIELLLTDINAFPPVPAPADDAPAIGVLDSGITSGHDLLGAAVGDAQGYLAPEREAHDSEPWHGTFVAGLALYGDVGANIRQGEFNPDLQLFSGKVFNDDGLDATKFVENAVDEAVRDLYEQYGCKVFNLSYGDYYKVYDGRHVRGLAYTLDRLTRQLGVLFVVPTGNLFTRELPDDPNNSFPGYLFADEARLLDPAPALNALTVGGLARHEATRNAQRHQDTVEDRPIAHFGQPFPLTRRGPSINGAIKPDFVDHAGNVATMRIGDRLRDMGLGVISLNGGFATGSPFSEDIGTSLAAPVVAHRAARILAVEPDASADLLRALLGAHARWPEQCEQLLNAADNAAGREDLLRLVGYGQIDERALYRSLDDTVTLRAEERLICDNHHFYEIPLPDSFRSKGRRLREVSVALAYSPEVRTTRLDYRATKFKFELVMAADMDEVEQTFTKERDAKEIAERSTGRWIPSSARNHGTLQVSRWAFRTAPDTDKRLFVVVTRQDSIWSPPAVRDDAEPYTLAVVLADQEQENARLYAELQAELQARAQVRARARVRG